MSDPLLYVGTFPRAYHSDTKDSAIGVYAYEVDASSGALTQRGVTPALRAGWLTPDPERNVLYVVNEVTEIDGTPGGAVTAYARCHDGTLKLLNHRRTGGNPCHSALSPDRRELVVTTFHGGTVELFPLDETGAFAGASSIIQHTGSSVHPRRQTSPHAHQAVFDPSGRFLLAPDLGTDQVLVHAWTDGSLSERPELTVTMTPGSGPRHLAFQPEGNWVHVITEMAATVETFAWDSTSGHLRHHDSTALLAPGFTGHRSAAELLTHPAGRFVYATNRSHGSSGPPPAPGEDSLVWLEWDGDRLHPRGRVRTGGAIPRTMTFDPAGRQLFVGHQGSSTIAVFDVDAESGVPTLTGTHKAPVPVCLQFMH
ncbi:MAG: lactonase family protein [Actinomycetota bacterium]|nr:lactonase family protein [Actinomycetota bacterium]